MGVERAGVNVRTFGQPRSGECPGILLVAKGLGRPRLRAFPYPLFGLKRNIPGIFGSFGTRAWLHFPSLSSPALQVQGRSKSSPFPCRSASRLDLSAELIFLLRRPRRSCWRRHHFPFALSPSSGCAWPDKEHTSAFQFCENRAEAVTWEATKKRVTPEFFATSRRPPVRRPVPAKRHPARRVGP